MIDTHAHLTDLQAKGMLNDVISTMSQDGLSHIFTVSYDLNSMIECVEIANKFDNVYAIIGVHPSEWKVFDDAKEWLIANLSNPKVIAVGEIGLDYHYPDTNKEEQKRIFVEQLRIANDAKLPICIHVRDAIGDLIAILKEHQHLINHGGLIHCFSESVESFDIVKKLGFKVAFGGAVTFKNASNLRRVVEHADLDDFVIETDCPYLTPEPKRGKEINQPKYVKYVVERIAEIKNCDVNKIAECTTLNALKLFPKVN